MTTSLLDDRNEALSLVAHAAVSGSIVAFAADAFLELSGPYGSYASLLYNCAFAHLTDAERDSLGSILYELTRPR